MHPGRRTEAAAQPASCALDTRTHTHLWPGLRQLLLWLLCLPPVVVGCCDCADDCEQDGDAARGAFAADWPAHARVARQQQQSGGLVSITRTAACMRSSGGWGTHKPLTVLPKDPLKSRRQTAACWLLLLLGTHAACCSACEARQRRATLLLQLTRRPRGVPVWGCCDTSCHCCEACS
jgi:hypothetical protein